MVDVKQEYDFAKNLSKKKSKVTKQWTPRGGARNPFEPPPAGGGILSPNDDLARENAWMGSTAFKNAQAQPDPFSLLQQQLFQAANGIGSSDPGMSVDALRKMAQQQVNAQFQPQIDALMAEMGGKSKRAERSEKTATDMYGGLAKDYLSQLPEITAQFAAEDKGTNDRYDQAQAQMSGEYQKNAAQQNALLKQLGVQAAAPDANAQMQADQGYFNGQMESDQQNALNALAQQQMAQEDYTRNLGSNAKMAGANLRSDISNQLEDYLTQANSQLTSLQGQRGSAVEALLAQMQQQQAEQQQKAQQQQFENMMKMYQFQLDATKASQSAGGANGVASPFGGGAGSAGITSGTQGAANYLSELYPQQPVRATELMDNLNAVLQNPDVVKGKFVLDPGNASLGQAPKYSDVGQEYMMNLLRHEFEKDGSKFDNKDVNATMNALLAYLGKLR